MNRRNVALILGGLASVGLGLGLWRQLPAGTSGAYQLLANLISLPKAPATTAAR